MAKQGFRVIDSDLHVIEPRDLWTNYLDPRFRGRIETGLVGDGQMRARADGKVLPPYADRPERQRAWSFRMRTSAWQRISRNTPPKAVLESVDPVSDAFLLPVDPCEGAVHRSGHRPGGHPCVIP